MLILVVITDAFSLAIDITIYIYSYKSHFVLKSITIFSGLNTDTAAKP